VVVDLPTIHPREEVGKVKRYRLIPFH
jgi:hypothetical protein